MDPHRLAELRSLALHRRIAWAIADDETIVPRAEARIAAWRASGSLHPHYAQAWLRLLRGPRPELLGVLVDEGETGRSLRQASPFSFVVPPRERWRLWRDVRARWESAPS